jgi:hypothetical protein
MEDSYAVGKSSDIDFVNQVEKADKLGMRRLISLQLEN